MDFVVEMDGKRSLGGGFSNGFQLFVMSEKAEALLRDFIGATRVTIVPRPG